MKKYTLLFALLCALILPGCRGRTMDYIIQNEPSVTGIVEEVHEGSILIFCQTMEGYPSGARCSVSLDVENEDSMRHFSVEDEVTVYYDSTVAESWPLQIQTVYAITLLTPAQR